MPNIAVFPEHTSQEVSFLWVSHWKFRLQFHDCFKLIEICAAAKSSRSRPALPGEWPHSLLVQQESD